MKTLTLQIFGLIFNLFLVFIIISYTTSKRFESSTKGVQLANFAPTPKGGGKVKNTLALKRISILLVFSYIIFNLNDEAPKGLSFLDGKIKINDTSILKTTFIYSAASVILYNQNGKTEQYIILLTNL